MEAKNKGNKLFSLGKVEEAIKMYSEGVDLVEADDQNSNNEDKECLHLLYANRSMAHLEVALPESALQDAECCIDTKPEFGKGYLRRALALIDLFQMKEALDDLDKAEELDAGLAPLGCESRLRAQGKKWVHNCYLKKQKRLQKELKCDYVIMGELNIEGKEAEDVVFPINFGKSGELMEELGRTDIFNKPEKKGEGTEGMLEHLFMLFSNSSHGEARGLSIEQNKHRHTFTRGDEDDDEGGKKKETTGGKGKGVKKTSSKKTENEAMKKAKDEPKVDEEEDRKAYDKLIQPYIDLVHEQLKREYGPTKRFEAVQGAKVGDALYSWATNCWLWHCNQFPRSSQECLYLGKRQHRMMFPGAPKWIDMENPTEFRDFVKFELDNPRPSHQGCGPATVKVEDFEKRRQQLKDYRSTTEFVERREGANSKCTGCGTAITDPDPQECLCGDIYCSYTCHEKNWKRHQPTCRERVESLRESHKWTVWYWRLVLIGYCRCKDEPELLNTLWKKRDIKRSASTWDQEVDFYLRMEKETHNLELDEIQRQGPKVLQGAGSGAGAAGSGTTTLKGSDHMLVMMEFTLSQMIRDSTPLPLDSPARLYQKFLTYRKSLETPLGVMAKERLRTPTQLAQDFLDFVREHQFEEDQEGCERLRAVLNQELDQPHRGRR